MNDGDPFWNFIFPQKKLYFLEEIIIFEYFDVSKRIIKRTVLKNLMNAVCLY